jgi:drug/metabolite transporter (DMT)-like permease
MSSITDPKPISAWIAFVAICIIWGTTYLGIKIGVAYMPGLFLAGFRNIIAGLILLIIAFFVAKEKPDLKTVGFLSLIGLFNLGMGNGLVSWAEEYVSSGLTAIICALSPLWIAIFSLIILRNSRLNWISVTGLFLGFLGIAGVFKDYLPELANPNYRFGIIIIIIANMGWGLGSVLLVRKALKISVFYISGIQMLAAGIVLLIASGFAAPIPNLAQIAWEGWAAIAYLVVFGSIISYIAYMHALKFIAPARLSVYSYINPLVALWLGWLVLNELLTWFMLLSSLITVIGVWMVNKGYNLAKMQIIKKC